MLLPFYLDAGLYNTYLVPQGAPEVAISDTSLDITAFAVSLLLVFRWAGVHWGVISTLGCCRHQ